MRYLEMGLAFAALGFVAAMTAGSLMTVWLWGILRGRLQRSRSLFLLRMVPGLCALTLVLGVVVPAFLLLEPQDSTERASPSVLALIAFAVALAGAGLSRALISWRATRRLESAWMAVAQPIRSEGLARPVYRVRSEMPFAALVGIVRPRLFVADGFFDSLSATEQIAVVRHENGHLIARDNLKRMAMRMVPDWLAFTKTGREIEAAWAVAAEEAADDHAAGVDRGRALDLASALLKAARQRPLRCVAVASFCDGATIAGRATRLLTGTPARPVSSHPVSARLLRVMALLSLIALLAGPARSATYTLLENAIRFLR